MQRLTGYNLVRFIDRLPKNIDYNYVNPRNPSLIRIMRVDAPDGPVYVKRWNPNRGETPENVSETTISTEMIWRVANALFVNQPINIDRVLGSSYNTRSVLESLLLYTPQFYYCYPGRVMDIAGETRIEHGHKHILWLPESPHKNGVMEERRVEMAISEIPTTAAVYDSLTIPSVVGDTGLDVMMKRRHTQIQVALYIIGLQLGYRTWIAQNDLGIVYNDKPLVEQEGVVKSLQNENLVGPFDGAVKAGLFIDCIWFQNGRLMPAVMEIEHTTGITSGLTRMLNFSTTIPPLRTRFVIVAPDEDRDKVIQEAHKPAFQSLEARYFPYSAVEELFVICQRRKLRGVTEEFLDCYMERTIDL